MHDDEVNVSLRAEPLEHGLKLWSVCLAGRLTGIDVDLNHFSIKRLCLAETSIPLSGDREAFTIAVRVDLTY
ncbi:MAG: hypothetical protein ABSC00_07290 [Acidimicrobiales bacterium]